MELSGMVAMEISISVDDGAARIRLVQTHREESPIVEALQRVDSRSHHPSSPLGSVYGPGSPHSVHSMTLRSHTQASLTPAASPQSNTDVNLPTPQIQIRAPGRTKRTMTPYATVATPESDNSAPPSNAASPSPATRQPRKDPSSTPTRSRFRSWEVNFPQDFTIWDDPPERAAEDCPPDHIYIPVADEDKENSYAGNMDFEPSSEPESQTVGTDEFRLRAGPLDVFGIPVNSTFGPALSHNSLGPDTTPSAQPTAVNDNDRPTLQVALREGDEVATEWEDRPAPVEIAELVRLNDAINRAAEQRLQHDQNSPERDRNAQRQRLLLEARRVARSRRQQGRRRRSVESG